MWGAVGGGGGLLEGVGHCWKRGVAARGGGAAAGGVRRGAGGEIGVREAEGTAQEGEEPFVEWDEFYSDLLAENPQAIEEEIEDTQPPRHTQVGSQGGVASVEPEILGGDAWSEVSDEEAARPGYI